jgi:serine/threonine protein kinase
VSSYKYLDDGGLCHRDIKSDNVVVSDDFSRAVLLDLGVVRWLDDDVGAGTDREGQLPFVATAQYSSPEYMFRLMPAGPSLWRALTFYQLGGLIHDLIMRRRLLSDIVAQSKDNRYLIAYAVATQIPYIEGGGLIPLDLVALAQRALDKDPNRRLASVSWRDFLGQSELAENETLLGVGQTRPKFVRSAVAPALARSLETALDGRLTAVGVHCGHDIKVVDSQFAKASFSWIPDSSLIPPSSEIAVIFEIRGQDGNVAVDCKGELRGGPVGQAVRVFGPSITFVAEEGRDCSGSFLQHAYEAFMKVSADIVRSLADAPSVQPEPGGVVS